MTLPVQRIALVITAAALVTACGEPGLRASYGAEDGLLPAEAWSEMPSGCEDLLAGAQGQAVEVAATASAPELVALRTKSGDTCVDSRVAVGEQLVAMHALDSARQIGNMSQSAAEVPGADPTDVANADPQPHPDLEYDPDGVLNGDPSPHPDASADPQPHPDQSADDENCSCEVIWVVVVIIVEEEPPGSSGGDDPGPVPSDPIPPMPNEN